MSFWPGLLTMVTSWYHEAVWQISGELGTSAGPVKVTGLEAEGPRSEP